MRNCGSPLGLIQRSIYSVPKAVTSPKLLRSRLQQHGLRASFSSMGLRLHRVIGKTNDRGELASDTIRRARGRHDAASPWSSCRSEHVVGPKAVRPRSDTVHLGTVHRGTIHRALFIEVLFTEILFTEHCSPKPRSHCSPTAWSHCSPSTVHRALFTEHCSPSTVHRALFTEHYSQSTVHRSCGRLLRVKPRSTLSGPNPFRLHLGSFCCHMLRFAGRLRFCNAFFIKSPGDISSTGLSLDVNVEGVNTDPNS